MNLQGERNPGPCWRLQASSPGLCHPVTPVTPVTPHFPCAPEKRLSLCNLFVCSRRKSSISGPEARGVSPFAQRPPRVFAPLPLCIMGRACASAQGGCYGSTSLSLTLPPHHQF